MKIIKSEEVFLYQIRVDLEKEFAKKIRNNGLNAKYPKLRKIFEKYNANLICQYDAFKAFLNECEKDGNTDFPLYKWTKDTISKKEKKEKYIKSFTIYVNNEQLYEKGKADGLEKELKLLNCAKIKKIYKYDSNPSNNPQPPKKYY